MKIVAFRIFICWTRDKGGDKKWKMFAKVGGKDFLPELSEVHQEWGRHH